MARTGSSLPNGPTDPVTRAVDRPLAPCLPWVTIKSKESNLNVNLQLRAQCFLAYALGDLRSAIEVFHHHTMSAAADGQSESAALKMARAKSASGVSSAGIGGVGFLIFWVIDARLIAGRWPSAAMAWFALGLAAAMMFAWHYDVIHGRDGWRLAWYRCSGKPFKLSQR
ncbi:MAG: hypothetical protein HKL99_12700 [Burkholderiales bacterium]|nr:hypothetical protein [Burkholderiales bacterium]